MKAARNLYIDILSYSMHFSSQRVCTVYVCVRERQRNRLGEHKKDDDLVNE